MSGGSALPAMSATRLRHHIFVNQDFQGHWCRRLAATDLLGAVACRSVGTALKLPRCFDGVLDGISVASLEISDNHHVLGVSG
jgi:hypothetical protein